MTSWIRRLRRHASQDFVVKGSEWRQLSLFLVVALVLLLYLESSEHVGALETVVTLSFLALMVGIALARWDWVLWSIVIPIVLAIGVTLSWTYWEVLHSDQDSVSTTIRNLGLLIGGVVAMLLAVWRSIVAERQADTAQQSLLNERYQKGAEMLGIEALSVRLGGIYALERLAADYPGQYHVQIMKLLCAFARNPTEDEDYEKKLAERNVKPYTLPSPREDVQAAINAIGSRDRTRAAIEKSQGFELNLIGADLSLTRIGDANLSGAMLNYADLSHTDIFSVDLSGAFLQGTVMKHARLRDIDFTDARAQRVNLSDANVFQSNKPLFDLDDSDLSYAQLSDVDLSSKSIQTANLDHVQIKTSDLSGTYFRASKLPGARIFKSNLSGATLSDADLSGARILRTDMSGATLSDTDLSGTYFHDPRGGKATEPVTGLTQGQLDEACADPDNPPKLDGVLDAETGEPLVWRGKPC